MTAQPNIYPDFFSLRVVHRKKKATVKKKRINFSPFGLQQKGYNNIVNSNGNSSGQKEKTFQGQRFDDDLGLDVHQWKYRVSDPAIGRFWQIDPLAEDYVYNGTYNFSENRVIDAMELEGLEKVSIHVAGEYKTENYKGNIVGSIYIDVGNNNNLSFSLSHSGKFTG